MRITSTLNAQISSPRDGTKQRCESGAPRFMLLGLPNHCDMQGVGEFRGEILIPWMPRSHQDIKALVRQAQLGDFHLTGGRVAKIAHFDRLSERTGLERVVCL